MRAQEKQVEQIKCIFEVAFMHFSSRMTLNKKLYILIFHFKALVLYIKEFK